MSLIKAAPERAVFLFKAAMLNHELYSDDFANLLNDFWVEKR
jgi:hypothetical protein